MLEQTPVFITAIIALAVAQGILMPIALLTNRKGPVFANRFLAALLLSMSFGISGFLLEIMEQQPNFSTYYFLSTGTPFLFGPLIYLYIKAMTTQGRANRLSDLLHFAPAALYLIRVYLAVSSIEPITNLREESATPGFMDVIWPLSKTLSVTIYVYLSISRLKMHRVSLENNLSRIDTMTLDWLKHILLALFLLVTVSWLLILLKLESSLPVSMDTIYSTGLALIIIWISLRGYQQAEILNFVQLREENAGVSTQKKSELIEKDKQEISVKLAQLMEQDKIYLEESISLPRLAEYLGKRVQVVSRYLNEVEDKNFYDFINSARIEDACRQLADGNNESSVLDIALNVGYNNKGTFNSAFRKYRKTTPSEFRKNARQSLTSTVNQ